MEYRFVAESLEGFVQQLACNYLTHGYWFFVQGIVPEHKDPREIDQKLLERYAIAKSRQQRARAKKAGVASLQYLRYQRHFVLLATHGEHLFFQAEAGSIRDVRRSSIEMGGYSVSVRRGQYLQAISAEEPPAVDGKLRVRVRIAREPLRNLKASFLTLALSRSAEPLASELYRIPFEPYAPVRKQLLTLFRQVNRVRKEAGHEQLPIECVRLRRRIVKPFDCVGEAGVAEDIKMPPETQVSYSAA